MQAIASRENTSEGGKPTERSPMNLTLNTLQCIALVTPLSLSVSIGNQPKVTVTKINFSAVQTGAPTGEKIAPQAMEFAANMTNYDQIGLKIKICRRDSQPRFGFCVTSDQSRSNLAVSELSRAKPNLTEANRTFSKKDFPCPCRHQRARFNRAQKPIPNLVPWCFNSVQKTTGEPTNLLSWYAVNLN
jgi:hypothetical protein